MKISWYYILIFLIFISSCDITKRHYRNGFFIQHHSKNGLASNEKINKSNDISVGKKNIQDKITYQNSDTTIVLENKLYHDLVICEENISTIEHQKPSTISNDYQKSEPDVSDEAIEGEFQDNSVEAKALADRAYKLSILALIFILLGSISLILTLIAMSKAKSAIWLNNGADPNIDIKAKKAILISAYIQLLFSIIFLVAISIMVILIA